MSTALIVLASGTSSRFEGGNKLLANLRGRPVAGHVIENLRSVNFDKRFTVVADYAVKTLFKSAGYSCVLNPSPENGQGSSLSLGVKAAMSEGYDSACVVLADMPEIKASHILALLGTNAHICMSENNGVRMPPAVFRGPALTRLAEAKGDNGAKGEFDMQNVTTITLSDLAACDIDTREDLDKLS